MVTSVGGSELASLKSMAPRRLHTDDATARTVRHPVQNPKAIGIGRNKDARLWAHLTLTTADDPARSSVFMTNPNRTVARQLPLEVTDRIPELMTRNGFASYDAVHAATALELGFRPLLRSTPPSQSCLRPESQSTQTRPESGAVSGIAAQAPSDRCLPVWSALDQEPLSRATCSITASGRTRP